MSKEGHNNCVALISNPGAQLMELIIETDMKLFDLSTQEVNILKLHGKLIEDLKVNYPSMYISYSDFMHGDKESLSDIYKECRIYLKDNLPLRAE